MAEGLGAWRPETDAKHPWQNWVKARLLPHVNVSQPNSLISQRSFSPSPIPCFEKRRVVFILNTAGTRFPGNPPHWMVGLCRIRYHHPPDRTSHSER